MLALCLMHRAGATELSYPEILLDDVKHVATSPARWEETEWHTAGWASLAVVGTALVVDRPLRDEMRRHSGNNSFITQVERFGSQYAAGVVGGFYVVGAFTGNNTAVQVAQDGIAASLIASGIVTPTIKLLAGRSRPRADEDIYNFKPFSDANSSFPSGHTTEAFALASVIANHYDETWVTCASYSIAGLVGLARTYHQAHFASDVVAGAMIGTLVGKSVVSYNASLRNGKLALLPDFSRGLIGVRIAGRF
ncbi:phosphatase PAP2 family protein [Sideroxydans lithotrophicus]|uniref:Phosphoesterase PA-phosphatase related protein n=1 Tax=Sideroxydans lithotrophicus (strain ES-1) TaxID=580332 RepID=D5CQM0_SIDLE|nr:phosphatase PAP2 family protein [Sideroxydans lithotrophicus]ADE11256.1 phosphoesterase PA-phosphatase related protein [Sideroxydans lithotrophicus ES-1]